jgi:hypothetical protein
LFVLHRGIAHMIGVKTRTGEVSVPRQSVMAAVLVSGGRFGVVRSAEEAPNLLLCISGQRVNRVLGGNHAQAL